MEGGSEGMTAMQLDALCASIKTTEWLRNVVAMGDGSMPSAASCYVPSMRRLRGLQALARAEARETREAVMFDHGGVCFYSLKADERAAGVS